MDAHEMTGVVQPADEVFGRRLRELRHKHGVTQDALVEASGLAKRTSATWSRAPVSPISFPDYLPRVKLTFQM